MVKALAFLLLVTLALPNSQAKNSLSQQLMDKVVAQLKSQQSSLSSHFVSITSNDGLAINSNINSTNMIQSMVTSLGHSNSNSNGKGNVDFKLIFPAHGLTGSLDGQYGQIPLNGSFDASSNDEAAIHVSAHYNLHSKKILFSLKDEPAEYSAFTTKWNNSFTLDSERKSVEEKVKGVITEKFIQSFKHKVHGILSTLDVEFQSKVTAVASKTHKKPVNVCQSESCKTVAKLLKENIDESVDPCYDFYNYSCSKFGQENLSPRSFIKFYEIRDTDKNIMVEYLMSNKRENDVEPVKYIHKLYKKCIETSKLNLVNLFFITNSLLLPSSGESDMRVLKKLMPLNNQSKTIADIIVHSIRIGVPSIVSVNILPISTNESVIRIFQPSFMFPRYESVKGRQDHNNYINFISKSFRRYFAYSADQAEEAAENIDALEDLLYTIATEDDYYDDERNYMDELTEEYKGLDLGKVINDLIYPKNVSYVSIGAKYLKKLEQLIKNGTINFEQIRDHQIWRTILYYGPILSDKFNECKIKFSYELIEQERTKLCLNLLTDITPRVVERAYIDALNLTKEDQIKITNMFYKVKSSFKKIFQDKDWLDDGTKKVLIEKLNNITVEIAFPEWIRNDTKLNKHLKIRPNTNETLFKIISQFKTYLVADEIDKLEKQDNEEEWEDSPLIDNAYYTYYDELAPSILLLAGHLRSLLFRIDLPDYFNFGLIGSTLGHEIGHAFDPTRLKSSSNLWSSESWEKFKAEAYKMEIQYNNTLDERTELYLNGRKTLNENVADNSGLRAAFYAVFNEEKEEPRLPGFEDWSDEKIFFLSYSYSYCDSITTIEMKDHMNGKDGHALNKHRVNIPLSNFDEFAKAFNCPANSRMIPKYRVTVW